MDDTAPLVVMIVDDIAVPAPTADDTVPVVTTEIEALIEIKNDTVPAVIEVAVVLPLLLLLIINVALVLTLLRRFPMLLHQAAAAVQKQMVLPLPLRPLPPMVLFHPQSPPRLRPPTAPAMVLLLLLMLPPLHTLPLPLPHLPTLPLLLTPLLRMRLLRPMLLPLVLVLMAPPTVVPIRRMVVVPMAEAADMVAVVVVVNIAKAVATVPIWETVLEHI